MSLKHELRLLSKKKLIQIPHPRREEASKALEAHSFPQGVIASIASFKDEINTHGLNQILAKQKRLALPRVEADLLTFYLVDNLDKQLSRSSIGILEPVPTLCEKADKIDVILVPALAFDLYHHRLGYGKGYYDRWLGANRVFSIGIGFKEQIIDTLPTDSHDIQLDELLLL